MDEMKIESKFLKGIISRWLAKQIKKKFGCEAWVALGDFKVEMDESTAKVHITIDAGCSKDEVKKLLDQVL